MTREAIVRMAREAGLHLPYWDDDQNPRTDPPKGWSMVAPIGEPIERFAALVAAREREECAKVCEEQEELRGHTPFDCAEAIRARGKA